MTTGNKLKRKGLAERKPMLDARAADDEAETARRAACVESARALFSGQNAREFAASFIRAYEEREAERRQEAGADPRGTRSGVGGNHGQ